MKGIKKSALVSKKRVNQNAHASPQILIFISYFKIKKAGEALLF
jgi:hypothetical protein